MVRIKNIHIRNFRSLKSASLTDCGPLNVLIGKNNSGKSSVLATIPLALDHLRNGSIASTWKVTRPVEQFTNRNTQQAIQIGIEFDASTNLVDSICVELNGAAPQLSRSIDQLRGEKSVSVIIRLHHDEGGSFRYTERISFGAIDASGDELLTEGNVLLFTPLNAAKDLFSKYVTNERFRVKAAALEQIADGSDTNLSHYFRANERGGWPRFIVDQLRATHQFDEDFARDLIKMIDSSSSLEELKAAAQGQAATHRDTMEKNVRADLSHPISTYTGEAPSQPRYIVELCRKIGELEILKLEERKLPIGPQEAQQLLGLKVKRGGPERLAVVQQTVKSLLGVSLDAFQGSRPDSAEIDVDNFLAQANGAGIRESLRLVLDLELGTSEIVLVEEPEVHLHPGLEFAVHTYLQEKSKTKQIFITTHSTNFVDTAAPRNIYLLSRDSLGISSCRSLAGDEMPTLIPAELGLRLSTVFMFDRLIFVEGPTDEAIIRHLATKLNKDLSGAGIAFVQLGGIDNFAHYAAESTLDFLSRRQVKMWFFVDRDEKDNLEIERMKGKLGDSAQLFVLQRRQLENFLIEEDAVLCFIDGKLGNRPTSDAYRAALAEACEELKDKIVQIYLEKRLLKPVYLRRRGSEGAIAERIASKITELNNRLGEIDTATEELKIELHRDWSVETAIARIPGDILLDAICRKLGSRFDKQRGDSIKLAKCLAADKIHRQLVDFLTMVVRPER